jgi:lipoxygenase homology domain-containing protein 1
MTKYKVEAWTGTNGDAGTNANVFVTLYGCKGDTGERHFENGKFEKGSYDTFTFESMDVGEIHSMNIRHDNSGHKPGWFLDRAQIQVDGKAVAYFPCNRWLADNEDDKRISRGLAEYKYYRPQ